MVTGALTQEYKLWHATDKNIYSSKNVVTNVNVRDR